MGIYETDRERRIVGDGLAAKQETFREISAPVGDACAHFVATHEAQQVAVEERLQADSEEDRARRARDVAWSRAVQCYANAYARLDLALSPNWLDTPPADTVEAVQQRLFPLGAPSTVAVSAQLTLDAITHLVAAVAREESLHFPEPFVASLADVRGQLAATLATASSTREAASRAARKVFAAREQWDTAYQAFKDITVGYLRLSGQKDRLRGLFVELPSTSRSAGPAELSPTASGEPTEAPDAIPATAASATSLAA